MRFLMPNVSGSIPTLFFFHRAGILSIWKVNRKFSIPICHVKDSGTEYPKVMLRILIKSAGRTNRSEY